MSLPIASSSSSLAFISTKFVTFKSLQTFLNDSNDGKRDILRHRNRGSTIESGIQYDLISGVLDALT